MRKKTYGKSGGVEVTDEMLNRIVEQAEAGFDVDELRSNERRGRRPMGKAAAVVFQVRLEPELHLALMKCAEEAGVTPSELARRVLRRKLKPR